MKYLSLILCVLVFSCGQSASTPIEHYKSIDEYKQDLHLANNCRKSQVDSLQAIIDDIHVKKGVLYGRNGGKAPSEWKSRDDMYKWLHLNNEESELLMRQISFEFEEIDSINKVPMH